MSLFIKTYGQHLKVTPDPSLPQSLEEELCEALSLYWSTAEETLRESGVKLLPPAADYFELGRNFFSALFLYSYHRAKIPKMRRILYAAVNQCLRGMVTGCDNILDDEYKKTLETDLPQQAWRFRSVLDIMVSDRVLFKILLKYHRMNQLTSDQLQAASTASLSALTRSGTQEASEEKGISKILSPQEVLKTIHHYKTGLLFQCPWAVPLTIENYEKESVSQLLDALYQIGLGCQVMDDMVDIADDLKKKRHNYVISLIYHDSKGREKSRLQDLMTSDARLYKKTVLLSDFPQAHLLAVQAACQFLESGLKALFSKSHRFLVEPSISYISNRIGADRFMSGICK